MRFDKFRQARLKLNRTVRVCHYVELIKTIFNRRGSHVFAFECVGQKNWLHCNLFPKHPVRFRHQEKLLAFLFGDIFHRSFSFFSNSSKIIGSIFFHCLTDASTSPPFCSLLGVPVCRRGTETPPTVFSNGAAFPLSDADPGSSNLSLRPPSESSFWKPSRLARELRSRTRRRCSQGRVLHRGAFAERNELARLTGERT